MQVNDSKVELTDLQRRQTGLAFPSNTHCHAVISCNYQWGSSLLSELLQGDIQPLSNQAGWSVPWERRDDEKAASYTEPLSPRSL